MEKSFLIDVRWVDEESSTCCCDILDTTIDMNDNNGKSRKIAGYFIFKFYTVCIVNEKAINIIEFSIDPEYQNKGYVNDILKSILSLVYDKNVTVVKLSSTKDKYVVGNEDIFTILKMDPNNDSKINIITKIIPEKEIK
jgi:hypothetical protein